MNDIPSRPDLLVSHPTIESRLATLVLVAMMLMQAGCTGVSGAVTGAAFQGLLTGAGAGAPTEWPFDSDPLILRLLCGQQQFILEASPQNARLTFAGQTVQLIRVFYNDGLVRYMRTSPDTDSEQGLAITEKESKITVDWQVLFTNDHMTLEQSGTPLDCQSSSETSFEQSDHNPAQGLKPLNLS